MLPLLYFILNGSFSISLALAGGRYFETDRPSKGCGAATSRLFSGSECTPPDVLGFSGSAVVCVDPRRTKGMLGPECVSRS